MERLDEIIKTEPFIRSVLNSIPCGLIVMDRKGCVRAFNDIIQRVFGVSEGAVLGKGFGHALCCVHTFEMPGECGLGAACNSCEIRDLAFAVLAQKEKLKVRTSAQLIIDNQVRDVVLLLSAVPFRYHDNLFCNLVVEDITKLSHMNSPEAEEGFRGILGRDDKMQELFDTIRKVGQTDLPVMILGESGTGKELVALAIHKESPRSSEKFVPVNSGALSENIIESELFGHVKGAFTGAIRNKKGRFELAGNGTIFLDEVAELSPATQVKLLRVLEDGCFEPLGSEATVRVDVRVISATNKPIEGEVEAGRFRQDLFYRLSVIPVFVPPLRDRGDDILFLAEHFLNKYSKQSLGPKFELSLEARSLLLDYSWPGNVRELQNAIQYAMMKCGGATIGPECLPPVLLNGMKQLPMPRPRESTLNKTEVISALEQARGNKRLAAQILGISRSTLYRYLSRQK